jgi:RNA polymerase sigma factor (sigma-70 family)
MHYEVLPEKAIGTEEPKDGPHSPASNVDFPELLRSQWGQVFRICLRITQNEHDAEDAAQDCFLRAFSHLHQFQGKAHISTWLCSIARNCSLMLLRKKRNKPEVKIDKSTDSNSDLSLLDPPDNRPDQLSRVLYAERYGMLVKSIAALPPTLRRTANLIILNELTPQEVGRSLDISSASVKARLFRARRCLMRVDKRRVKATMAHRNSIGDPGQTLDRD